jgi:release factor glutamine methyltransferase
MSDSTATPTHWTIGNLLTWTKGHFEKSGVEDARLCAELLLAKAMGLKRIELYARFEQSPTEEQRAAFRELVRAAAAHQPIAYLIGTREFYSLEFKVTPDVLIPRPETELLVERALVWCKEHPQERIDLWDIGTGSGCIAITVAKRCPAVHAVASDISEAALKVAAENADRRGVGRIRFVHADLLDLPAENPERFDIILCNPPYIAETDRDSLPANVRDYEPAAALFAGFDALAVYRRIAGGIHQRLRVGGLLALEVGQGQAAEVEAILVNGGALAAAGRFKDLAGIERVVTFTLRS